MAPESYCDRQCSNAARPFQGEQSGGQITLTTAVCSVRELSYQNWIKNTASAYSINKVHFHYSDGNGNKLKAL